MTTLAGGLDTDCLNLRALRRLNRLRARDYEARRVDLDLLTLDESETALEEAEGEAKSRRCRSCSRLVRGLRALWGRQYCSARCAHGRPPNL